MDSQLSSVIVEHLALKLRIQTVTRLMSIPIEMDLIFKRGYKLREEENKKKNGGNPCALRAGKGEGARRGDMECSES